jgi:NAD(P)-dependent dehydrogenase (short-subunit alcohol dehydrogenase family)
VVDTVESAGSVAAAYQADLTDPDVAIDLIETIVDNFGRLDAIVYNAGVFYDTSLEGYDREMYDRTFGVNVDGAIYSIRAALEVMQKNDPIDGVRGRVVGIT